jgi:MGT family glycosyltransferase
MKFGCLSFVGTGHLYPTVALARCLRSRGHEVTVFYPHIGRAVIKSAGLVFEPIDDAQPAPSGLAAARASRDSGLTSLGRLTVSVDVQRAHCVRVLQHGRPVIASKKLDALIVDQAELTGSSIADILRLPFVTLAITPHERLDPRLPPSSSPWLHRRGPLARLRNRVGNAMVQRALRPALSVVNQYRREWGLPPVQHRNETLSPFATISQMPERFDFSPEPHPAGMFYTGPFVDDRARTPVPFAWDRLDGRPLVYASMGTIRNELRSVFPIVAAACEGLGLQLILSLGGGRLMPEDFPNLPGDPLVVHYAPQLELIRKAALVITHAGINTTLEALRSGVPLVAIPVTDDQPGVAARIASAGVGRVVPIRRLSVHRLRECIIEVLRTPRYVQAAQRMRTDIEQAGGLMRAAEIVESVAAARRS